MKKYTHALVLYQQICLLVLGGTVYPFFPVPAPNLEYHVTAPLPIPKMIAEGQTRQIFRVLDLNEFSPSSPPPFCG